MAVGYIKTATGPCAILSWRVVEDGCGLVKERTTACDRLVDECNASHMPDLGGKHQGKIAGIFVEAGAVDDLAQREYGLRTGFRRAVSSVGCRLNHDASSWTIGGGPSWIRFETLRVNV